jgi:hypothetical protein
VLVSDPRLRGVPFLSWQSVLRIGGVLVVVVIVVALGWRFLHGGKPSVADISPGIRPAEFLYIDTPHVLAFLSQLEDGLSDSERRTSSVTSGINVGLTGGIAGGISNELTGSVDRVVTPTGASRFSRLRNILEDRAWLQKLDAHQLIGLQTRPAFFTSLRRAAEGEFVEISHVRLTLPPAVTVYRFARRSGTPAAARFVQAVGRNPRVPMSLRTEYSPTLLFVGRYGSLADESSFFFGEVTVLGKVIRQFDSATQVYRDGEALATYGPALSSAPASILRKLRIRKGSLAESLRADVQVVGPGAVILPIAIYK